MKKLCAILLCCALCLTTMVGCGNQAPVLTEDVIITDLIRHSGYYNLAHAEGTYGISNLKILEKTEEKGATIVSVSASATNNSVRADLTATIGYLLTEEGWEMDSITISDASYTVTGAPNQDSLLSSISNYITVVGSAYAVKGDKEYELKFNPLKAVCETTVDKEAKTAQLKISYKDKTMNFTGHYNLTFGKSGWIIESKRQEDDREFPILYLETYKKTDKK